MIPQLKAALATYARAFLTAVIAGMVALNISPLTMTHSDFVKLANAIWVSLVPVILRALNPKDNKYGLKKNVQTVI